MPGHFTSDRERKQTFLVDFDDLSPEDEYDMASNAWYEQPVILSKRGKYACVSIGEDVMLGCYILTKLGSGEESEYLKNEIVALSIRSFPEAMRVDLQMAINTKEAQDYFGFCERYGILKATGADTSPAFTRISHTTHDGHSIKF